MIDILETKEIVDRDFNAYVEILGKVRIIQIIDEYSKQEDKEKKKQGGK